jgi:hypothetical protein
MQHGASDGEDDAASAGVQAESLVESSRARCDGESTYAARLLALRFRHDDGGGQEMRDDEMRMRG